MTSLVGDPGLQAARTVLAWRRTFSGAVALNVALAVLALRVGAWPVAVLALAPLLGLLAQPVRRHLAHLIAGDTAQSPWNSLVLAAVIITVGALNCIGIAALA